MLDFSINTVEGRVDAVSHELNKNTHPKKTQLEMYANYILYAKDENGQNSVDKGDIEIKTKYDSYKKREIDSIEDLLENPIFSEQNFQPIHRTIYKNPKPELDTSLPELQDLIQTIKDQEALIDRIDKEEPPSESKKTKLWKLKHLLINLKKEQYVIQNLVKGTFKPLSAPLETQEEYFDIGEDVRPLGLKIGNLPRFTNPYLDNSQYTMRLDAPSPRTIDLEDPAHIYAIFECWEILYEHSHNDPWSNTKYLLETVDWYAEQTPLSDSRRDIIRLKKLKFQNKEIQQYLNNKYGTTYNENYISTIYTKEICKKIADQVTYETEKWLNRKNLKRWKKCRVCGQYKFLSDKEFKKKKSSEDGFGCTCKDCIEKKKKEREGGANNRQ